MPTTTDDLTGPLPVGLGSFFQQILADHLGFVLGITGLGTLCGVWGPITSLLMKSLIDGLDRPDGHLGMLSVLLVVNFEIGQNLSWRIIGYLNARVQPRIKAAILEQTCAYGFGHSQAFFGDHLSGKLSRSIVQLADGIERIVHQLFPQLVRGAALFLAAFVCLYRVHPLFFLVLLLWCCVFAAVSLHVSRRGIPLAEQHTEAETRIAGKIDESLDNAASMRLFARGSEEIRRLSPFCREAGIRFQTKERWFLKLNYFQGFSFSCMVGGMLALLLHLHKQSKVTSGGFALILMLVLDVGFTLWGTMEQIALMNREVGKCRQSLSLLFVPHAVQDADEAVDLVVSTGRIDVCNVSFGYQEPLFQGIHVSIPGGETIGLVGYSGGGKSTFVNLLLRLYDVHAGAIWIDGQDICQMRQNSLRRAIAMIPQDPTLFHRSLLDNIRYGSPDASEADVFEAAKRAQLHDFILSIPGGYQALVGERGVKLSGGQRQRIAMARAFLKNAPILILDEATSQLDSVTESDIQKGLGALMHGKTVLVIAHRLSTLRNMDRILVFDKGCLVEDGTPEELLTRGGLYQTLWACQSHGFLPEVPAC